MLLLAASLLFIPHYEVTRAPEVSAALLTTDAKGYAYLASQSVETSAATVTKVDPDGNPVYEVSPTTNTGTITASVLDAAGNIYLALSVSPPSGGLVQGFVAKLDPSGKVLFNYPFPAPSANALALAPDGGIYLTGSTEPATLGTTPSAWVPGSQSPALQAWNPFAIRLSPTGQVVYATFLDKLAAPVNDYPTGTAIAADAAGNAYIGGQTFDPDFPTTPGAYLIQCCTTAHPPAAFLMKLNPSGSAPIYSTFLPGDTPTSIVLDAAGNAKLTIAAMASAAAISTAQLSAGGDRLTGLTTTDLHSLLPSGLGPAYGAAIPDGQGNILVTSQSAPSGLTISEGACACGTNLVAIVRQGEGSVLYASLVPNGAGGLGIAPDGSGGFVVLGTGGVYANIRPLAMLTRFAPAFTPAPAILGLVNVAESVVGEGLAPGEMVGIYGMNLGPDPGAFAGFTGGALPLDLGGTEVLFNGIRAPLRWAGNGQVNALVPFELSGSPTANVQVRVNGQLSNVAQLPVLTAEPAIFSYPSGYALALNQDGSVNSQQNPAQLGSVVTIFLNGAGLQTPAPADGIRAPFGPIAASPVEVQAPVPGSYGEPIWKDTHVLYAGAAPGEIAGLMQVNFRLPSVPAPSLNGQMDIVVIVGGLSNSAPIWAQ
jgi:uncharacterized protein (TIGR03437 family)